MLKSKSDLTSRNEFCYKSLGTFNSIGIIKWGKNSVSLRNTKGVLKIKFGYNANSSSVSSDISVFQLGYAAATCLVFIVLTLLFAKRNKKKGQSDGEEENDDF